MNVFQAGSVDEALAHLEQSPQMGAGLIALHMPKKDGIFLAREINKNPQWKGNRSAAP